jgi:lupus La protein
MTDVAAEKPVVEAENSTAENNVAPEKGEAEGGESTQSATEITASSSNATRKTGSKFDASLLPESSDPAEVRKQVCTASLTLSLC